MSYTEELEGILHAFFKAHPSKRGLKPKAKLTKLDARNFHRYLCLQHDSGMDECAVEAEWNHRCPDDPWDLRI